MHITLHINLNPQELKIIMAKLDLATTEALIATIANGNATDPAVTQAVTDLKANVAGLTTANANLQAALSSDEGNETALAAQVTDLSQQLSDHSTAITDIVTKLQAPKPDVTGALATATAVPPVVAADGSTGESSN